MQELDRQTAERAAKDPQFAEQLIRRRTEQRAHRKAEITQPTPTQEQGERAEGTLPPEYRADLRRNLAEYFNRDELRTLCFDLGIDHESLPEEKDGMARELVAYCERHSRIPELVEKCRELRPNVLWEDKPE
jgi:hypothetical protein